MSIVLLLGSSFVMGISADEDNHIIRDKFNMEYQAFIKAFNTFDASRSTPGSESRKYLQNIADLGVPVLPCIYDKMKENNEYSKFLKIPFYRITKKHFDKFEWPKGQDSAVEVIISWYTTGRKQTPQRFNQLYTDWKNLKKRGKTNEANAKYQKMCDLGIDALPLIMQQIEKGDKELIPMASYLTDNNVKPDTKPSDCLNWWNNNKDEWTLPNTK